MSADRKEVFQGLCEVIAEVLKVDKNQLKGSQRFVEDLGVDSLDSVELLMAIEVKFGIAIEDSALNSIHTIDDAVSMIADQIVEKEIVQKKQEKDRASELKKLGVARFVWKELEEKSGKAFVERTGYPYIIYDGSISEPTEDPSDVFAKSKIQAVEGGYYKEWLLKECSAFLGQEIVGISLEVVASVIALSNMLVLEDEIGAFGSMHSSRWDGYSSVMTKDGVVHDKRKMISTGKLLAAELLNHSLVRPFEGYTFNAIYSKKKGDSTHGEATVDLLYTHDEEFYVSFSILLDGKKKPVHYDAYVDLLAGKWVFHNGKSFIEPRIGNAGEIFNTINGTLAKIKELAEKKLILAYSSYKLGIDAKTITLTLAKNIQKINQVGSNGAEITFRDARSYPGYILLYPSKYLLDKCLSHLISKMRGSIQLLVDGEVKQFFPKEYITADITKQTVALTGVEVSERGIERNTYDLSLCGKKSYLAREDIMDVIHVKQVTVGDDSRTRECLNQIAYLLRRLY